MVLAIARATSDTNVHVIMDILEIIVSILVMANAITVERSLTDVLGTI